MEIFLDVFSTVFFLPGIIAREVIIRDVEKYRNRNNITHDSAEQKGGMYNIPGGKKHKKSRGVSTYVHMCNKGIMWTKVDDMAGSPLTVAIRMNR